MGRPSIAEQRRIEIGRALQTCMVRNGSYSQTSVKDIAQEANVAGSLIHHYFESKDEILFMMTDLALLSLTNELEELLHAKTEEQRLNKLREIQNDKENNCFLFNLYFLSVSMPEVKRMIEEWREEWLASLMVRIRRNEAFSEQAEECARQFMFLLEAMILYTSVMQGETAEHLFREALDKYFPLP